jgi:hypothetical protein
MVIAVVGSRSFGPDGLLRIRLDSYIKNLPDSFIIMSGGAKMGPDCWAKQACSRFSKPYLNIPANWSETGKYAGYIRNETMANMADMVVAIWDGESKGTKHMIGLSRKLCKPVIIVNQNGSIDSRLET